MEANFCCLLAFGLVKSFTLLRFRLLLGPTDSVDHLLDSASNATQLVRLFQGWKKDVFKVVEKNYLSIMVGNNITLNTTANFTLTKLWYGDKVVVKFEKKTSYAQSLKDELTKFRKESILMVVLDDRRTFEGFDWDNDTRFLKISHSKEHDSLILSTQKTSFLRARRPTLDEKSSISQTKLMKQLLATKLNF